MSAFVSIDPLLAGSTPAQIAALAAVDPGLAVDADIDPFGVSTRDRRLIAAVRRFDSGKIDGALADIATLLEAYPGWVDGHAAMAQLLSQTGSIEAFEAFLVGALRRCPHDMALATSCLRLLSEAERHATVDALIPELRRSVGEHLFFTLIEAITASECDDAARAERLFAQAAREGGALSLPHVRHLIRTGDATRAATIAEGFVYEHPHHQGAWGLLATAWRMIGDSRHAWLVEQPDLVRVLDVDMAPEVLDVLAERLRTLHVARFHPFDQSLRGGTQTTGRIFRRDDPEIRDARRAMMAAVRSYLDLLPPVDPAHPLLGRDRSRFQFTDSWSVRLLDGGYHISHFHPQGTISSAFYVTVPEADSPVNAAAPAGRHAGWLTIGEPPEALRTGLPPLRMIEPVPGRLALFPSFLWHGTRPFPKGERMTMAFDTILGD